MRDGAEVAVPFGSRGGRAQARYEALRAYMLLPRGQRPRSSAARFDLDRFARFGLLGLLERDPAGEVWRSGRVGRFEVEVIPVGTVEARDRRVRLWQFLTQLATAHQEGDDDKRCALRPGLDRVAGERANDPKPACRRGALR